MDEMQQYKDFLLELKSLCLFYGIVINGNFEKYEDLMEVLYEINLKNKTIRPTKIAYTGLPKQFK